MQYEKLLIEEKGKLLNLVKKDFIKLDFSKVIAVLDNNLLQPLWMDIYILIYKCNLPADIQIYDIILKKLSTPTLRFYFKDNEKRYIANIDERMLSRYVWYHITGQKTEYYFETQYIPKKDYIKEIFKFNRFFDSGIYLKHLGKNKFKIEPTNYEFDNINDASLFYNKFLDAYDIFRSLKLSINNFISNIDVAMQFGKDKRMIATISNILSYFNIKFKIKENYITCEETAYHIKNESDADKFQVKLIDAYQFFRNVVNTENKKDIVSEIYNRKLPEEIRKQFEQNVSLYFRVVQNQELVDWIVTISKESKYTLKINFDENGVFEIDDVKITTPTEAKEFYIDYMDKKKEKLAMAIYKNGILGKIKNIWNKVRAKFIKI